MSFEIWIFLIIFASGSEFNHVEDLDDLLYLKLASNPLVIGLVNISDRMIELEDKYVFHIPLYKYKNDELVVIEMEEILDNLISEFAGNGFDSFYISEVKSFYKSRIYDEILITVFSPKDKSPLEIFKKWFIKNNHILCQEAFAYEIGDKMIIKKFLNH